MEPDSIALSAVVLPPVADAGLSLSLFATPTLLWRQQTQGYATQPHQCMRAPYLYSVKGNPFTAGGMMHYELFFLSLTYGRKSGLQKGVHIFVGCLACLAGLPGN